MKKKEDEEEIDRQERDEERLRSFRCWLEGRQEEAAPRGVDTLCRPCRCTWAVPGLVSH
jgi:hypothetical protein